MRNYWISLESSDSMKTSDSAVYSQLPSVIDSDGNIYSVSNYQQYYNTFTSVCVILNKYSSSGEFINRIAISSNGADNMYTMGITIDSENNIYILCASYSSTSTTANIYKFNSNLEELLHLTLNGNAGVSSVTIAAEVGSHSQIAVDSSGYIYVTFRNYNSANNSDWVIVKLDNVGSHVWTRNIRGYSGTPSGFSFPYSIKLDSSNNIYVLGNFYDTTSNKQVIIKFDSSGNTLLSKYYTTATKLTDIYIDSSNNVYTVVTRSDYGIHLCKYDSSLNQIFNTYITSNGADTRINAYSLYVDEQSNSVYIAGRSYQINAWNANLIKCSSTDGSIVWERKLGYYTGTTYGESCGFGVIVNSSGDIIWNGQYANTVDTRSYVFLTKLNKDGSGVGGFGKTQYYAGSLNNGTLSNELTDFTPYIIYNTSYTTASATSYVIKYGGAATITSGQ